MLQIRSREIGIDADWMMMNRNSPILDECVEIELIGRPR